MRLDARSGQMTVEFAAVFPVMLVFAAVALHALAYTGECARFDEVARTSVRLAVEGAASPEDAAVEIARTASQSLAVSAAGGVSPEGGEGAAPAVPPEGMRVSVSFEEVGLGRVRYTVRMEMDATLFGMPLREVAGFKIPPLVHETSMTVPQRRKAVVA